VSCDEGIATQAFVEFAFVDFAQCFLASAHDSSGEGMVLRQIL